MQEQQVQRRQALDTGEHGAAGRWLGVGRGGGAGFSCTGFSCTERLTLPGATISEQKHITKLDPSRL